MIYFKLHCNTVFLHSHKRSVLEVRGVLFLVKLNTINTNPSNIEATSVLGHDSSFFFKKLYVTVPKHHKPVTLFVAIVKFDNVWQLFLQP